MATQLNVRSYIGPRDVRRLEIKDPKKSLELAKNYKSLEKIGISLDHVMKMAQYAYETSHHSHSGMDADLTPLNSTASISTPVQFLQSWLPGFVYNITAVRVADELMGIMTQGTWEDEEIVQGFEEFLGTPQIYGDYNSTPYSSWNTNYERRTIIRYEEGFQVGRLEESRAARERISSADSKRIAAAEALEIERNRIGFRGFNSDINRTYGFLNDPQLPDYVVVADSGENDSTFWVDKDYLAIVGDLLTAYTQLRTQSQGRVDPKRDPITLAIALNAVDRLSTSTNFGYTVRTWIKDNYPNTRIVPAPELNTAGGSGGGVFYMYAESISGTGTDDNRTWIQVVPQRFLTLGVDQRSKSYEEVTTNATAGAMLKRPWAVVRYDAISEAPVTLVEPSPAPAPEPADDDVERTPLKQSGIPDIKETKKPRAKAKPKSEGEVNGS